MRLAKLDLLRGLTLISMISYHFTWDLVFLYGFNIPWYNELPGFLWQQSICWTFILLSGFSWSLGHHHLKRGLIVFLCGAVVTAATLIFMPADVVWFGILTFMGSAMLLMIPVDRLLNKKRTPALYAAVLIISLSLFAVTKKLDNILWIRDMIPHIAGNDGIAGILSRGQDYLLAFLGLPFPGFFSTDYFPIIPWFFLYLTGYLLYQILMCGNERAVSAGNLNTADSMPSKSNSRSILSGSLCPPLEFIGRHTLIIYLLHQPLILLITMVIFR